METPWEVREKLERSKHRLTIRKWRRFLWKHFPKEFVSVKPLFPTAYRPGSENKKRVMEERRAAGMDLHHMKDAWYLIDEGTAGDTLRNGTTVRRKLVAIKVCNTRRSSDLDRQVRRKVVAADFLAWRASQ